LNHLQKSGGARIWEIAVPNGTYSVFAVSGDPDYIDSVFRLNVEGVLTVSGTPTSATHWFSGTSTVTVSDGRLTVSNGTGASNDKICFIEITSVAGGSAFAPPLAVRKLPILTLSGPDESGEMTVQIDSRPGQTYVVEASDDLIEWTPLGTVQSDSASAVFIDLDASVHSYRFYRVAVPASDTNAAPP
jgi:hypothetical protein